MEYAAVSIAYIHSWSCCSSKRDTHYLPEYSDEYLAGGGGGHAVTMIGWDDNFPSNNFVYTPPGNGAILCKNSWGETSGTNGCFWISYYDSCLFNGIGAAYPVPETTNNYGRVYEFDPCGYVGSYNVYEEGDAAGSKTNWCANVFPAVATGVVEAVGFYSLAAGMEYELKVYNQCGEVPNSGTLVSRQCGTNSVAGYVTIKLATPVPITKRGERFAVVLKLESDATEYPIPVERWYNGYCIASSEYGESFLSGDGETWTDFKNVSFASGTENICIKAYTKAGEDGEAKPNLTLYVDQTSEAEEPDGSEAKPFHTISNALDVALDGDTIAVKAGVYRESVNAKPGVMEIRAMDDPDRTIIDGEGMRYGYDGTLNQEAVLRGFTIRNCAAYDYGAGAYYGIISHCVISNCQTISASYYWEQDRMGIIYFYCDAMGGGVYGATCENCLVVSNCAMAACYDDQITFNAFGGGAAYSTLINCTVADNTADSDHYAYGGGLYGCAVYNTIAAFNEVNGYNANCVAGENVCDMGTAVKLFADGDPRFVDRANGNYRLAAGSQCIDAGFAPALEDWGFEIDTDLAGAERFAGWEIDQGCYEYSQEVWFRDWTLYDSYAAQTNEVVICADGEWKLEVEVEERWINPLVVSGTGCTTVKVEVAVNESADYRYGTIYLYGAGADYIDWCDIVQAGKVSRGETHYGLFVGINEYQMRGCDTLQGCVSDALKLKERATKSGLWHDENTTVLTNALATTVSIHAALTNLAAKAVSGDTVFYTHSSHGGGYDSAKPSAVGICCYNNWYYDTTLAADLALFKDGVKVIVLIDACQSGGLFKTNAYSRTGREIVERMSELVCGPAFIAAADFDQNSWDGAEGGYFASALVDGWRTGMADSDGDGKLNFLELADYARARAVGNREDYVELWTEAQLWNDTLLADSLAGYVPGVWPECEVIAGDAKETEKVQDAMIGAGFSTEVATAVTNVAVYQSFMEWSAAHGVTIGELKTSATALLSAAFGAEGLLELESEDIEITDFEPSETTAGEFTLTVSFEDYEYLKSNAALLKSALGVTGTASLNEAFTTDGLVLTVTPAAEAIEVKVAAPAEATGYFFKVKVR